MGNTSSSLVYNIIDILMCKVVTLCKVTTLQMFNHAFKSYRF